MSLDGTGATDFGVRLRYLSDYLSIDGVTSIQINNVEWSTTDIANHDTAYGWGNHAGLYEDLRTDFRRFEQTVNIPAGGAITEILEYDGTSYAASDQHELLVRAYIPGTGTDVALVGRFYSDAGAWSFEEFYVSGTSSNHLKLGLTGGGLPGIGHYHPSAYNASVEIEQFNNRTKFGDYEASKLSDIALGVTANGWGDHASGGYAPLASPTFTGTVNMATLNAGNIDSTGSITASSHFKTDAANANGYGFWGSAPTTYGIFMSQAAVQGRIATDTTSDYNMYFEMNSGTNRGFVFEADGTKRLSANMLHIDGKEAIDGNDTLLRLNQNSDFSAGIYTPGNFKMDGNLFLKERATSTGDQATYAQVWIKNSSPQELWFTTEDGVEHHVSGGSFSETFGTVKSSTEDVTSSTTLQNDDELFIAMAANTVYSVTMILEVQASSLTPDFKFDFAIPTGADGAYSFHSTLSGGTSIGASADWTTDQVVSLGTTSTRTIIVLQGSIATSSTAGNLQLRWAQNTSSIDTVFVRSGSSLMLVK
jgi:hypothetical protein